MRIDWNDIVPTELNLDKENIILLNCCRLSLSQDRQNTVSGIIKDGIDWDVLTKNAIWHRLLPLVSTHLTKPEISGLVPGQTVEKMQRYIYANLARNILFQNELSHIVGLFNEQGIDTIVLKGAAFLGILYKDIALRPMSDLDILVRETDLLRAEEITLQQGYKSIRETEYIENEDKLRHLPNLVNDEKQIMLEIHKHITDIDGPYKISIDDIWSRARRFSVQGVPALTLSTEDHLIHLATNFILDRRYDSQHALGQLCDISEIIVQYQDEIDWILLEKTATEQCLRPSLFFTFYACDRLLGTRVPEFLYNNLQPADFDCEQADLFLRRRVIDERAWLVHNLVNHQTEYSVMESVSSGVKRLLPDTKRIFKKDKQNGYYFVEYLKQLKEKISRLLRIVIRPSELKENLTLDKWLHDLYDDNSRFEG